MEANLQEASDSSYRKSSVAFPKRCELVQETAENVVGAAMEVSGQQTNLCHNPLGCHKLLFALLYQ